MPTIVDSLVVVLNWDTSGVSKGQKANEDALKKARAGADTERKAWEANNKRVAESFRGVKNEVVGLAAAVLGTASIIDFSKTAMTTAANVGYLAKNLGISVGQLSTFEAAVRQVGGTTASADQSLTSLAMGIQQFNTMGRSPLIGWFQYLNSMPGPRITSEMLLPENTQHLMDAIHDRFKNMAPRQAMFIGAQMGLSPETIRLLQLQDDAYKAQMATAQRSAAITEKQAADMQKLQQQLAPLTAAWSRLGLTLLTDAAPALIAVANAFEHLAEEHPNVGMAALVGLMGLFALNTLKAVGAVFGLGRALAGLAGLGGAGAAGAAAVEGAAAGAGISGAAAAFQGGPAAVAAAAEAAAGVAATGVGSAIAGALGGWALALIPSTANAGEDRAMAAINARYYGQRATGGGAGLYAYIRSKLAGAGIDPNTAVGITAGIDAEGGTPTAFNSAGGGQGAFGIGQWRGARLAALRARYGPNPTLDQQIEFLLYELRGGDRGGSAVLGSRGAGGAASAYISQFMRPGLGAGGDMARVERILARGGGARASAGDKTITVTINEAKTPSATARAVTSAIAARANRGLS